MAAQTRRRSQRMQLRTTPEEREVIDRAVEATGTDLASFVVSHALTAAQRVLADRQSFVVNEDDREAWDALNARPSRDLPGLRKLMERPSPFTE